MTKEQQEPFQGELAPCYYCGKKIKEDYDYLVKLSIERDPEGNRILEKLPVHNSCVRRLT